MAASWLPEVAAQVLLFALLTGLAASVDLQVMKDRLRSWRGLATGMCCQFFLLPFLGFLSVKLWQLPPAAGVALLAVTSSPGGAYSNWWCSIFNADLALSVVMTMCSTLVSMVCTPLNLALYTTLSYGSVPAIRWGSLVLSISVAVLALASGTALSLYFPGQRRTFNILGNVAGISLIALSVFVSTSGSGEPLWNKALHFYGGCATPCVLGVTAAFTLGLTSRGLSKPEAVALTVETGYQNTGLAMAIAIATFSEEDRAIAAGVPLFYGVVQVAILPLFLGVAWKAGYTHAPPSHPLYRVIMSDYQPKYTGRIAPMPPSGNDGAEDEKAAPSSEVQPGRKRGDDFIVAGGMKPKLPLEYLEEKAMTNLADFPCEPAGGLPGELGELPAGDLPRLS